MNYFSKMNRFVKQLDVSMLSIPHSVGISLGFVSVFLLYLYTLSPEIATGDSAEFVTSAYLLGVSHPPGYPLYNMIGKLFSLLPYGNIAWRINLSAAVCSTAAAVFIYLASFRITKHWPSALLAAAFFATSPVVWEYSLKAEVFPLNNLFAAIIVYLLMVLRDDYLAAYPHQHQNRLPVYGLLLVCGLALTNHHTIILLAPGVLLALWFYARHQLLNVRVILTGLMLFLIGLSVYVYIPIRAHAEPYANWDNAQTWANFVRLVTRADYGTFKLVNLAGQTYNLFEKYWIYGSGLFKQLNPVGFTLAVAGVVSLFYLFDKKLKIILLACYGASSVVFIALANVPATSPLFLGVFERFYLLPQVIVAVFIALGAFHLPRFAHQYIKRCSVTFFSYITIVLAWLSLGVALYAHFPMVNQRDNFLLYHYGRDVLNMAEPNAIIVTQGDLGVLVLEYLQQVYQLRPDVIVLCAEKMTYDFYLNDMRKRHPNVTFPFVIFNPDDASLLRFVQANSPKHAIYSFTRPSSKDHSIYTNYQYVSLGLIQKIVHKDVVPTKQELIMQSRPVWQNDHSPVWSSRYPSTTWELKIIQHYMEAHTNLGFEFQRLGLIDMALQEYKASIRTLPSEAANYKNIGIIYANNPHTRFLASPYFKRYLEHAAKEGNQRIGVENLIKQYDAEKHFNRGFEFQQLGLYDLALQEYKASIPGMSHSSSLNKNMGIIYTNHKHNPVLAMRYLKRYLAYAPKDDKDKHNIEVFVKKLESKRSA